MLRTIVVVAVAVMSACGTTPSVVALNEDLRRIAPSAGPSQTRVAPGAVLSIDVEHEPEISGEHRVLGDGTIQLALCGSIDVGGRSAEEISDAVVAGLQEYIREPVVRLELLQSAPAQVHILGEVREPGAYPHGRGMTVSTLVVAAGGLNDSAADVVVVSRPDGDTEQLSLPEVVEGRREDPTLAVGDVVYVPEAAF